MIEDVKTDFVSGNSSQCAPSLPRPYSPDQPFVHNISYTGDCWKECLEKVDHYDVERCKGWREDIDTLLVFAGLFSAVVTAFTVESYQWLDDDPQDATAQLLLYIVQNSNISFTSSLPPSIVQNEFAPPNSAIRINICWFLSLTLSLTAVIVGILCKQWIGEHRRNPPKYTSHKDTLFLRRMRQQSFERWGVSGMTHTLPLLLEIALALFFLGVLDLLWSLNTLVAGIISAQVGLALLVISATTILPTLSLAWNTKVPCAYKSPQAWLCYRLWDWTIPKSFTSSRFILPWKRNVAPTFNQFFRGLSDWFDSDTAHGFYVTRDINYSLVESAMDWINESFGASREVSLHIYHCLADYSHFQGSYLPRSLRKLSDLKRYQLLTRYHEWYWWDDYTRRHMLELLLRAVADPETSQEDVTVALDRLGRIAVALTTWEGNRGEPESQMPLGQQPHTADADPKRFRNLGEELLLQVFATLNHFSLSDRADTTQFLACYSILNRYWLRISQEWPDRLGYPSWDQPTSFLDSLTDFVLNSPERYRIARISKCAFLLNSIVAQPHMSFSLSGDTILDFAKMLDKKIFAWGIGPSLVNMGYEKAGGDTMPWRDLYRSVVNMSRKGQHQVKGDNSAPLSDRDVVELDAAKVATRKEWEARG
ncbi:hypothetical protein V5O48_008334 [Marasmius crinis-equi]|uniref:DUF6535 domain-containing protein n=1 Tax=Marasmius crinis-equi TaxID=585013 RepID=A0ABR3FED6_9AGAR